MSQSAQLIAQLPYSEPFLFVDEIEEVSADRIRGNYKFREDAFFYKGHFKDSPVTPGVILTECIAQIGLSTFGIYLANDPDLVARSKIVLVASQLHFYELVFPKEKVTVYSEKQYFRFGKLKCKVKMLNENGRVVCDGEISGMIHANI